MPVIDETKASIAYAAQTAGIDLRKAYLNCDNVRDVLSTMQQADLEALGFDTDSAYLLKFFFETKLQNFFTEYAGMEADLKKIISLSRV